MIVIMVMMMMMMMTTTTAIATTTTMTMTTTMMMMMMTTTFMVVEQNKMKVPKAKPNSRVVGILPVTEFQRPICTNHAANMNQVHMSGNRQDRANTSQRSVPVHISVPVYRHAHLGQVGGGLEADRRFPK